MTRPLELPYNITPDMVRRALQGDVHSLVAALQRNFEHLAGLSLKVQQTADNLTQDVADAKETPIQAAQLAEVLDTLTITQRDTSTDALVIKRAGPSYVSNLITVTDENGFVFFLVGSNGLFNTVAGVKFNASSATWSSFLGADDIRLLREAAKKLKLDDAAGGAADLHITGSLFVDGTTPGGTSHTHSHDDPAQITGVSPDDHHAEVHALSGSDHTGAISAAQHPTIATGNLHPEYATDADLAAYVPAVSVQQNGSPLGTASVLNFKDQTVLVSGGVATVSRDLDADLLMNEWAYEAGQLPLQALEGF